MYVVDDDEDDRVIIKIALESFSDCEVSFFEDGAALLSELSTTSEEHLPALVLLDLDMPRMNGYEVLQALRTNPVLCIIPVLVLSGKGI